MGNGHGPPRLLSNADYQTIASGLLMTSGAYEGCIKIDDDDYRWISPDENNWELNSGAPGESQVKITTEAWDKCKSGGTFSWDSRAEAWDDGEDQWRWAGYSGQDVQLVTL